MSHFHSPLPTARAPNGYAASAPVTPAVLPTPAAPEWAVRTQRALTPLVRFPPLHATLLARPPFSYLFDILASIHRSSTLFDDSSDADPHSQIPSDWWRLQTLTSSSDPGVTRLAFAERVLRRTESLLGHSSGVRPSDVIQSRECEATCRWLHQVAELAITRLRNHSNATALQLLSHSHSSAAATPVKTRFEAWSSSAVTQSAGGPVRTSRFEHGSGLFSQNNGGATSTAALLEAAAPAYPHSNSSEQLLASFPAHSSLSPQREEPSSSRSHQSSAGAAAAADRALEDSSHDDDAPSGLSPVRESSVDSHASHAAAAQRRTIIVPRRTDSATPNASTPLQAAAAAEATVAAGDAPQAAQPAEQRTSPAASEFSDSAAQEGDEEPSEELVAETALMLRLFLPISATPLSRVRAAPFELLEELLGAAQDKAGLEPELYQFATMQYFEQLRPIAALQQLQRIVVATLR